MGLLCQHQLPYSPRNTTLPAQQTAKKQFHDDTRTLSLARCRLTLLVTDSADRQCRQFSLSLHTTEFKARALSGNNAASIAPRGVSKDVHNTKHTGSILTRGSVHTHHEFT